eukprot:jgi/Mesvir1/16289/Mv25072-RA.2
MRNFVKYSTPVLLLFLLAVSVCDRVASAAEVEMARNDGDIGPDIHPMLSSLTKGQSTRQDQPSDAPVPSVFSPVLLNNGLVRTRHVDGDQKAAPGSDNTYGSTVTEIVLEATLAASADEASVMDVLRSLGVETFGDIDGPRRVRCWMPLSSMPILAEKTAGYISSWKPAFTRAIAMSVGTGSATSQGDSAIGTDVVRTVLGLTGSGVKVGILGYSFNNQNGMAADIASGDLPSDVEIIKDYGGAYVPFSDDGRAMAQIVHDVAPEASIRFHTAYADSYGKQEYVNGIMALRLAGCQVIFDGLQYVDEPMFMDGIIADAVNEVKSYGAVYISYAGNGGKQGYSAPFRNGGSDANGVMHDFDPGPGVATVMRITVASTGALLVLNWDQLWYRDGPTSGTAPGALSDLDVYCYKGGVASPTDVYHAWDYNRLADDASASGNPFEYTWLDPGMYDVRIYHGTGITPRNLWMAFLIGSVTFNTFGTDSGTVFGHTKTAGAISVGSASAFQTPEFGVSPPELYSWSARGGIPNYYDTDGNAIAGGTVLLKPDVVGPTNVDNTFYGSYDTHDYDNNNFKNFAGPGAGAAHVAGFVALMLQYRPSLSPDDVADFLKQTAINMDVSGFDVDTGYGLVNAISAFEALGPCKSAFLLSTNVFRFPMSRW